MKNRILRIFTMLIIVAVNNFNLNGQIVNVPANFPQYKITENNSPNEGYFFLAADKMPDKKPGYLIMVDNYGTPVYYRYFNKVLNSFGLQKNGLLSFMGRGTSGAKFFIMDSTFAIIDSVASKAPYTKTDPHDFVALKNGHFLFIVNDPRIMDMSAYGGKTNATVTGCVVQEQDENKNVVFSWNTWDHFQIADSYADLTISTVDLIHHNSIDVDEDGNIFLISRSLNEVTKINRQTGDIIWRLGGKNNQFTFTDPSSIFSMPHDFRKLPNGNFTIFDNGNERNPAYTRAIEYSIDEVNKKVDVVWCYDADKKLYADNSGSSTKLETGNTVLGFGYSLSNPAILEIHPDSSIAFRLELPEGIASYRAFKAPWKNKLFEPMTTTIDFGKWDGYTTADYLLIMKNNSNNVVTLTSYSTHTDAFKIENTFPLDIPANGQVTLTVKYYPATMQTGLINDILTINSDINTSSLIQRISSQVKLSGSKSDAIPPVASISLAGKENVPQDTVIYINFNEPIRKVDNTEFNYSNVDPLIVLKKNNASGENVPFDAVINTDKNKITIRTKSLLSHTQNYYISVAGGFEDYSNNSGSFKEANFKTVDLTAPIAIITPANGANDITNSTITITYNEPVRNIDNSEIIDANVASLVTLKLNDSNGANVGFTCSVSSNKTTINITPNAQLLSNTTYYVAIGDVLEDFNNNKSAAVTSTFTTKTVDITAPIAVITPLNNATNVNPTSVLTITYNEPVRNIDNSELTNTNISSLITFKVNSSSGTNVGFSASINSEKTTITVTPSTQISYSAIYYLAIGDVVEDYNNNKAAAISSLFTTTNATEVSTLDLAKQILIYPNPSNGLFNIQLPTIGKIRLQITDLTGRIIYDKNIHDVNNHGVDLRNCPDGLYILTVKIDGCSTNKVLKLLKQHE